MTSLIALTLGLGPVAPDSLTSKRKRTPADRTPRTAEGLAARAAALDKGRATCQARSAEKVERVYTAIVAGFCRRSLLCELFPDIPDRTMKDCLRRLRDDGRIIQHKNVYLFPA